MLLLLLIQMLASCRDHQLDSKLLYFDFFVVQFPTKCYFNYNIHDSSIVREVPI